MSTSISKEAASFIETAKTCKGQFIRVKYRTNIKLAAAKAKEGYTVIKEVDGIFRTGIDYANLGAVKAGIEAGERNEVGGLPWGEWSTFPWIISHKGAEYVRLYPVQGQRPDTRFGIFLDGVQQPSIPGLTIKEAVALLLTPAEAEKLLNPKEETLECITKKLEDVSVIGCWHNEAGVTQGKIEDAIKVIEEPIRKAVNDSVDKVLEGVIKDTEGTLDRLYEKREAHEQ